MAREKLVRSIERNTTTFGHEFDRALGRLIIDQGMAFFTDEQLAAIRAEMVRRWLLRRQINRENRRRAA